MTRVTYIIGTYPLLTTTFIDREIRMLRSWGVSVDVVSLRRPVDALSPEQAALAQTTTYVRPVRPGELVRRHIRFLSRRPRTYLSTLARLATATGPPWRERLRTIGHFGLAVHVAGHLADRGATERLHAHFIDRAALVAHVAAQLLDVPYSITAHASDIYVAPVLLDKKIEGADFVATCTGYNQAHLSSEVDGAAEKVAVLYHGLEVERYQPAPTIATTTPMLVSVGQLKAKKGFLHLLDAARLLTDRGIGFHCEIIGEGPQRAELERKIRELGLEQHIVLRGALDHDEVIDTYRRASAFVLPCVIGDDGDRDGIPNVILEAMAMQLAVVSTTHSGIPEAVENETTGLLVPPGDAGALARALALVLEDQDAARRMGARGREVVIDRFDAEKNVRMLYDRFALAEAVR